MKTTAFGVVYYQEGCEAGTLFTWTEFGIGIGDQGTEVPPGPICFDSPRSSSGPCDASNTGLAASSLTPDQQQSDWRYCRKCHAMFFDGYTDKGVCPRDDLSVSFVATPSDLVREGRNLFVLALIGTQLHVRIFDADGNMVVNKAEDELARGETLIELKQQMTGTRDYSLWLKENKQRILRDIATIVGHTTSPVGGHVAQGFQFVLPHSLPGSAWAQTDWRFCHQCHTMFFDGYPSKGACPAGGGHAAAGLNFALPHDVSESALSQNDWRFCHKCHTMFFDGYSNKGFCPAGGGHAAAGFNFVLPHS